MRRGSSLMLCTLLRQIFSKYLECLQALYDHRDPETSLSSLWLFSVFLLSDKLSDNYPEMWIFFYFFFGGKVFFFSPHANFFLSFFIFFFLVGSDCCSAQGRSCNEGSPSFNVSGEYWCAQTPLRSHLRFPQSNSCVVHKFIYHLRRQVFLQQKFFLSPPRSPLNLCCCILFHTHIY